MDTEREDNPQFRNEELIANYHTHTTRCGHARGTEREFIECAIQSGIRILGFADHAPYPFPETYHSGMRMDVAETESYTRTLCDLRNQYQNNIKILIGYELEYFPVYFDAAMRNICAFPVDYLILGQHFIDCEMQGQYAGAKTADQSFLCAYVDQVIKGLETGVFSYLAHPDLPNFTGEEAVYRREMRRLCEAAKQLDIPLEINFLGLKEHRQYPCERFFRIAGEVGNSVIFGCDAHWPQMLSDKQVLKDAVAFVKQFDLSLIQTLTLRDPQRYFEK